MANQVPEFTGGRASVREKLNDMGGAVNALRNIRGDETFIGIDHTPSGGIVIRLLINQVQARIPRQIVPIVVACSVGSNIKVGFYNGTMQSGQVAADASSNLSMPQGLSAGASCLLLVMEENGYTTAAQRLASGGYVEGIYLGDSTEATPRPIVVVVNGPGSTAGTTTLTPGTYGAPRTTTWSRATNGTPVSKVNITSWGFDSGSGNWWVNYDITIWDARGCMLSISAETQIMVGTNTC